MKTQSGSIYCYTLGGSSRSVCLPELIVSARTRYLVEVNLAPCLYLSSSATISTCSRHLSKAFSSFYMTRQLGPLLQLDTEPLTGALHFA